MEAAGGCLTAAVLEEQLGERLGEVPVEGLWARPVSVSASGPRGKRGPCLPLCGAGCRSSKCPGLCPVFYVFVPVVFPLTLSLAVAFGCGWMEGIHDAPPPPSHPPALGGSWSCQQSRAFFQGCVTVPQSSSMSLGFPHGSFPHSWWNGLDFSCGQWEEAVICYLKAMNWIPTG